MKKFDLTRFFANNSVSSIHKANQKRRRGRTCRIEELENREMLDAGFLSALDDAFNRSLIPDNDTVIVDTTIPETTS